jgi:putative addiction module component (TIGR02574 family)
MDSATEQLYQAALALPDDQRLELVEALIASEDSPAEVTFDPATLQEIKRRSAEIDAGTVELNSWSVVRERVRKRVEERSRG